MRRQSERDGWRLPACVIAAVVCVLALGSCDSKPTSGSEAESQSGRDTVGAPSTQDGKYLVVAHQSNLAEIEAARMAQDRVSNGSVQELATALEADHSRLDETLREVAKDLAVPLPAEPDADQQAELSRLRSLPDDEFERAYLASQLAAHDDAVRNGRAEMLSGREERAIKIASDAAPIIDRHHEMLLVAANG